MRWVRGGGGQAGDPLQAGLPGLGGIPDHPAICRASRVGVENKPCESRLPGASSPRCLGRVQRRRRSRHRREDKAVASQRLRVFLRSLATALPLQLQKGGRRGGDACLLCLAFFPRARLPNLVCVRPCCCDSGAKLGCCRHSGVPSTPRAAGLVLRGTGIFRGGFARGWRAVVAHRQVDSLAHGASTPLPISTTR